MLKEGQDQFTPRWQRRDYLALAVDMTIDDELNSSFNLRNEITVFNKLAESAAKIAWLNFEWRYATMVVFNSTMFLGIDAFIRSYQQSVIIGKETFLQNYEKSGDNIIQFVVFGTDLINIMHMLDWMREHEFDNTGKFIFICQNCDESEAMEIFWSHKIINVILIKNISGSGAVGFTYFLYNDENCQISRPVLIEESCTKKPCLDMFPVKLANFHTCQVIVSTFIQRPYMSLNSGKPIGADGDLLLLIVEALNATLKVMTPHRGTGWGMRDSDGDWTGSLGDIYYDLANFSMTSAAITLTRYQQFHMSKEYHSINMVWVTHPAVPLPAWEKLLHPFQMKARISLTITFSFVVIVAVFVKSRYWVKLSSRLRLDPPRSCIIFYSWTICMGMPTTLPSKPAFLYIFFLWVLYCFMMRTFYQASLIHAMKDNNNYPEFENLEDILSSGYPLGGVSTLKDYFLDEPRVFNNWVGINSTEIYPTMVNLSKGMKYVLAMNMDTSKSFLLDRIGDLHIVPQKIVSSPTVLFFKKFSPMAAALNRILGRLTEGGFTEKLYKNHAAVTISKPVDDNVPMNMGHYMGCYVILATGWIVSMLFFIFELYYNKLHCLKFRNNSN